MIPIFFNFLTLACQYLLFFQSGKWRVLQICLEKTQVSLFCCSLLSTFLSHIRHFTTPNGIKKKKLLLMQSYVAMLFYFFIKSKQYSCNNREKTRVKSSINGVNGSLNQRFYFVSLRRSNSLVFLEKNLPLAFPCLA